MPEELRAEENPQHLKEILDKFSIEEIIVALFEDVECPWTLNKALANACAEIVGERLAKLAQAICDEITAEAEKHNHFDCPMILFTLYKLHEEPMTIKDMQWHRDTAIEHIQEM